MPDAIERVKEIISQADLELRSVEVNKPISLDIDIGNLLAIDTNDLDKENFSTKLDRDEYLKGLARDGVQLIINRVWDLPSETIDNMIYAQLPKPTTRLPREKPVPKPKPLTKWDEYAKAKGIKKKKKGTKLWDDILQRWIPRYGFQKVQAEKEKNWLIEVPNNADPYEDQFAKAATAKQENIARNEYLRLRNIAKAKNIKVPKLGVTSETMSTRGDMEKAIILSKKSTASLGKFQAALPKEKPMKENKGQKRKLPRNETTETGLEKEKRSTLEVLKKMKRKELDMETAVNKQIRMENIEMSQKPGKNSFSARRSKRGGKPRGKSEHKALAKGLPQKVQKQFAKKKKSSSFGHHNAGKGRESRQKVKALRRKKNRK